MKFQKNFILKKLNKGFTLIEFIISTSLYTFLIILIVSIMFILYSGFTRLQKNSSKINDTAVCFDLIFNHTFNPDIYPHHLREEYFFSDKSITFFANGGKVEYNYSKEGIFTIKNIIKNNKEKSLHFPFFKDFKIKYFDIKGNNVSSLDEFPYSCEMKFKINDKQEISVNMRL